ncbi:MAG: hypothetical protein JXA71_15120 [Chitinispirillaceae bacterium]|nr:hypothetical protein [Chitinispirillaceae bacterium]
MTKHIAIVGIPGSGKSAVVDNLAAVLAAEFEVTVCSAGSGVTMVNNDQDLSVPGFRPDALPWKFRFSRWCVQRSLRYGHDRRWFPLFRLLSLTFQDIASREIADKTAIDLLVSEDHPVISFCAGFYRQKHEHTMPVGGHTNISMREIISHAFYYLLVGGKCMPHVQEHFPHIDLMHGICSFIKRFWRYTPRLPDLVFFLDRSPALALPCLESEGRAGAMRDTAGTLAREREYYLTALKVFQEYRGGPGSVHSIHVDELSIDRIVQTIVTILKEHEITGDADMVKSKSHGTNAKRRRSSPNVRISGLRLFCRYLIGKWSRGSWREPLFFFSRSGRRFLDQGYTPPVIRGIYDHDAEPKGMMERVFHHYPLHRAMADRLRIVTGAMEKIIRRKLTEYGEVTVFSGPGGFAYEVFRPLEAIAADAASFMGRIKLFIADPDPSGTIEPELTARARRLGVTFSFIKGNIWSASVRTFIQRHGPFDIVLFTGSAHWLPKRHLLAHLRWIRRYMEWDSLLVTDCFTPDAYSLAVFCDGYKTHYYSPALYGTILNYCGFDGDRAVVDSGRDAINHVVITCPRYSLERTMLPATNQYA